MADTYSGDEAYQRLHQNAQQAFASANTAAAEYMATHMQHPGVGIAVSAVPYVAPGPSPEAVGLSFGVKPPQTPVYTNRPAAWPSPLPPQQYADTAAASYGMLPRPASAGPAYWQPMGRSDVVFATVASAPRNLWQRLRGAFRGTQ